MIKVEVDELKNELGRLQKAIEDFKPYSQDFIKNTIDGFDEFNSDFIEEIKKTLGNMTDTKAPEVLKNVQAFHDGVLSIVEEFEKTDVGISEQTNLDKTHE